MKARLTVTALVLLTLTACGTARTIDTAHVATIACAADGEVHAQASQYAGGQYTLNGGAPVTFSAGFDLTLDGARAWTLVVTADDGFPTFTDTAGPCRTPSTSASSSTFPTPATFGFPGGSTTTTTTSTTSPPTPATFAAPGGTTTTTTTVVDSTTTTAAPPVTTAVVSSTTVVPTTTCPVCTAPPPPPAGLPVTAGIGVNAWLGAALLVVLIAILGWACYRRHA